MKSYAFLAAASMFAPSVDGAVPANRIPITGNLPGWSKGTPGAPIQITVWYDLLCPASKNDHYVMKELLDMDSHIEGKKYSDLIDMQVTPFVLPYHLRSWAVTKVIHLLKDKCDEDATKCEVEKYAELAWSEWQSIAASNSLSAK